MRDPRSKGNEDHRWFRTGGWFRLSDVGGIRGGSSLTDPVTSGETDKKFLEFWFQGSGSGDFRGLYLVLDLSVAGQDGTAIRGRLNASAATGNAQGYGGHFTAALENNGIVTSGLFCGARCTLEIENPTGATNYTGNGWAALQVDSYLGANVTLTGSAAFIRFADVGTGIMPYIFNFRDMSTGDTLKSIQVDSGAVGTIYGYARVILPSGIDGYIALYSSHS